MLSLAAQSPIGLESLPPVAHILAGLGIVAGLFFWLLGRKLLRVAFWFMGAVVGGFVGFFMFPSVSPETVFGAPSPYVGAGAGFILGMVIAMVLYRFAVAIVSAGALAAVGALVAATVLQFGPVQETREHFNEAPVKVSEETKATATGEERLEETRALAARVNAFLGDSRTQVEQAWDEWPPHHRAVLGIASGCGLFLGFVIGLFAPKRGASGATALFGAAVWLLSAVWLINAMSVPGREYLARGGAIGWLVVWLAVAGLGFAFQTGLGRGGGGKAKAAH